MPTIHVEPDAESLLQEIANTLWKSRKVVVITGAGISTNSGIPDFRSENGLYSLIQAQFDAAAAAKQADRTDTAADESDACPADIEERPAKRRRLSRDERTESVPLFPGLRKPVEQEQKLDSTYENKLKEASPSASSGNVGSSAVPSTSGCPIPVDVAEVCQGGERLAQGPGPPHEPVNAPVALTPLPSPKLPSSQSDDVSTAEPSRIMLETPTHLTSSPPTLSLDILRLRSESGHSGQQTINSSPLSSPPQVIFNPFQEPFRDTSSSSASSTHDDGSSRSQSEEPSSASTPLLTSQSSFVSSSSRTSLPNMKGRDLFDAQIWSCPVKTSVFYTFATTLRQKVRAAEPTSSHRFVSVLRDSRKLVRCYTQNIDQLEERVGLSTSLSLGAGNRYRFSVRAGRASGVSRASLKTSDTAESFDCSQQTQGGSSHPGEVGPTESSEGISSSQGSATETERAATNGQDTAPEKAADSTVESSLPTQPESSSSSPTDLPSSTPSAPPSATLPPAPNRGVECVFLHGSLSQLRCFVCARSASWDDEARQAYTLSGRQPDCPHCAGAAAAREERGKRALGVGKLRPDIVLYGEEHPDSHLISPIVQHDLSLGPDMLLILGTSMRVHGLKVLVREFAKAVHDRGGKVVFVNFTKPPESVWAEVIDFWVQWDCDAWVGDLQARKPALWLPPGTVLPEEEKPKTGRASRRQSGGETSKRKESAEKPGRKKKESEGTTRKVSRESTKALEELEGQIKLEKEQQAVDANSQSPQTELGEMLPPPPPTSKPGPWKPARASKEPKLNPDAKRPASVRDHKLNGAYLVWKIRSDLRKITGGEQPASAASTPAKASKPRAKRPRKSAPAALQLGNVDIQSASSSCSPRPTPGVSLVPKDEEMPDAYASSQQFGASSATQPAGSATPDSSITAAVKARKRKQTVTWKMVRGVETRVSIADEPAPAPLPNTEAVFRPAPAVKDRMLPNPVPVPASQPSAHRRDDRTERPAPTDKMLEQCFRETDRLIAKLSSRPSTPLHLAPIRIPDAQVASGPKLEPLEPKVTSPGPRAAISSNVGSPVAARAPNPFFFADPLINHMSFPPPNWHSRNTSLHDRHPSWCPEEQLQKEQEAAMMLSMLSRG